MCVFVCWCIYVVSEECHDKGGTEEKEKKRSIKRATKSEPSDGSQISRCDEGNVYGLAVP